MFSVENSTGKLASAIGNDSGKRPLSQAAKTVARAPVEERHSTNEYALGQP